MMEGTREEELQDHDIFPQAYLKRHGLNKKADLNTIANRTLISDETNGKIKDKAPATYLHDPEIFPSGTSESLLGPHFIDPAILALMEQATETLTNDEAAELYDRFFRAREQAIITKIRAVCGIEVVDSEAIAAVEEEPPDEVAPDVLEKEFSLEDELAELALDVQV